MANRQIGVIELDHSLDIDEVTEIFIRINSKGTPLSQSDFVMSKMASDTAHGGNMLRKVVDYFCHLAVKPDFYPQMTKDKDFEASEFAQKIKWLAKDNEDIYDPDYRDMLRVAFMYSFNRGRLSDLVSLLSGRDFETREYKDEIVEEVRLSLIKDFELEEPFRQRGIFFDGMAHVTLLRGTDFVPGGTLAFGYRNGVTLYSLYTRFDYFLSPLGSETGRFATLEFSWENGLSFEYVITSQDWQEVKLAVDFGYYLQYIERSDEPSVFYLSHNGLMIRPTISVKANLLLFRIELGLYYQMGVYPRYEDYDGFGLYIKLF